MGYISLRRGGAETTIRFLSVETQVERVDLQKWLHRLDWVIQAGGSGRHARPFDLAWGDDQMGQCRIAQVPVFVKQLGAVVVSHGERISFHDGHGGDWSEWPERLRVRQTPKLGR